MASESKKEREQTSKHNKSYPGREIDIRKKQTEPNIATKFSILWIYKRLIVFVHIIQNAFYGSIVRFPEL